MRRFKVSVQIGEREVLFRDEHLRSALRIGTSVFLGGCSALVLWHYLWIDLWLAVVIMCIAPLVFFWCGMKHRDEQLRRKRLKRWKHSKNSSGQPNVDPKLIKESR